MSPAPCCLEYPPSCVGRQRKSGASSGLTGRGSWSQLQSPLGLGLAPSWVPPLHQLRMALTTLTDPWAPLQLSSCSRSPPTNAGTSGEPHAAEVLGEGWGMGTRGVNNLEKNRMLQPAE